MGYLEHVLIHTFLCVLAVSMVLKFLNFAAINRKSGVMMIAVFMILTHVVNFFYQLKQQIKCWIYTGHAYTGRYEFNDRTLI